MAVTQESIFQKTERRVAGANTAQVQGRVIQVIGLVIECSAMAVPIGSLCLIHSRVNNENIESEVVGFRETRVLLMPFGEMRGISAGDEVVCIARTQTVGVGMSLLGRVINARGHAMDDKQQIYTRERWPIYASPPDPIKRKRIDTPLATGIRAIDSLVTVGRGQRMGIFAGSGVGKSVTMGMIARYTEAEVNVIALVGERGREVRDFLEKDLGEEGLRRSVVVVATSDQPALLRVKAAFTATAVAEYFRDQGKDVILMMDSVTRMAMAQREIGLSVGEPPATKGYTPSVFSLLPRLLERSGRGESGSITGFYTVLVEADDFNEPISDAVRAILDGHIMLSRALAIKGHYPAIDVLGSISRVMIDIVPPAQKKTAEKIGAILASYRDAEDLINIGAYADGSNAEIDYAKSKINAVNRFLRQDIAEPETLQGAVSKMTELLADDKKQAQPGGAVQNQSAPPPGNRVR